MDNNTSSQFSNTSLQSNSLPALQNLPFENLSPKYLPKNRLINFSFTLFFLILGTALHFQTLFNLPENVQAPLVIITFIVATLGGFATLYGILADPHKQYALREQDVTYRSGLIFKKMVTQPILRIQHVELKRGPVDRKIGLAKLQVFSAGGAMHTFEIPGLAVETAEKIRQFILDHKDSIQNG